jgi:hypothetical protein
MDTIEDFIQTFRAGQPQAGSMLYMNTIAALARCDNGQVLPFLLADLCDEWENKP